MLIPNVVAHPPADLTCGVAYRALLRGALDKQLVVLGPIVRVFSKEYAEDRVVAENIRVQNLLLRRLDGGDLFLITSACRHAARTIPSSSCEEQPL